MNSLILKNINISEIVKLDTKLLTIKELFTKVNYNLNNIYIDKFWDSIQDDKWVYIDEELMFWLGYKDIRFGKESINKLLKRNFIENEDYKILSNEEFNINDFCSAMMAKQTALKEDNRGAHNKQYITVSPDCFKELCMHVGTGKSKEIKKYYIELEKVFKFYLEYQNKYRKLELENNKKELEEAKNIYKKKILDKTLQKQNEYVYVASSKNYVKNNIYKIGKTVKLENRMKGYQTGRMEEDKFVYLYIMKCSDSKVIEQLIFSKLKTFKIDDVNELYQLHFDLLKDLLDKIEILENELFNSFNNDLVKYYDICDSKPNDDIEKIIIHNVDLYIENKFNIKEYERYVPILEDKTSPLSLTTEKVNSCLLNNNLQLVGEYNGKSDARQMFKCLSVLNHVFENTYDEVRNSNCKLCGKQRILDDIPIYEYADNTFNFVREYKNFNELKKVKPNLNFQLLRNIIREKRWFTAHENYIYTILSPDTNNKFNVEKHLSENEKYILSILEIDINEIIRIRNENRNCEFVLALDTENKICYYAKSMTMIGNHLKQKNSTKLLNRKTISKKINTNNKYGGYLFITSNEIIYEDYNSVDVLTLKNTC